MAKAKSMEKLNVLDNNITNSTLDLQNKTIFKDYETM